MRHTLFSVCAALASIAMLGGQSLAQSADHASTQISKEVEEVSINVAAYDKNRPVLDLAPDDLKISDSGVPVRVSSVRLVRRDSELKLLTLVFDRFDSTARGNARKIAARILKSVPESGFDFAVFSVDGGLRLHQEFTSERPLIEHAVAEATEDASKSATDVTARMNQLSAAAKGGQGASGTPLTPEQRARAQALLTAVEDARYLIDEQHPTASLAALLALIQGEGRLPGQKVIFFITQDPSADAKDAPVLSRIITSASAGSVEIVTFDANATNSVSKEYLEAFAAVTTAMSVTTNTGVRQATNPATAAQTSAPAPTPNVQAPGPPLLGLGDIKTAGMTDIQKHHYEFLDIPEKHLASSACRVATYTGGACVQASDDPDKTVRRVMEDISTYYEVSFVPATKEFDGKFHEINLKALRHGVKLRSRNGYFAVPPETFTGSQPFEAPLLSLLAQPTLPDDVPFDSRVLELGAAEKGTAGVLLMEIPIDELETRDDANTHVYTAHVSVLAQIKDTTGRVVQYFTGDIPQHGSLEEKEKGTADNVRFERPLLLSPGDYQLELAVLDRNSGKSAARRSTLHIGDASHPPFLSDLTLVARMDPLPAEVASAEPLRYGSSKIVPELAAELPAPRKQISIFSIIHANPQSDASPRLSVKLVRNGQTLAQVPLPLPAQEDRGLQAHVATIDASSLPGGNYQVVETLAQGDAVSEKATTFQIAGDATPAPATASAPPPAATNAPAPAGEAADNNIDLVKSLPTMITETPAASVTRPSAESFQSMVSAATRYALRYSKSLPNFLCMEVTRRSVDDSGRGQWKTQDSFTDLLGYDGKEETRKRLETNGERYGGSRLNSSLPVSIGQFGGLLNLVFTPKSKASFDWQGATVLGSDTVQVLKYTVVPENASITLRAGGRVIDVGFHGLIFVDPTTGGIHRITVEADKIPSDFPFHSTAMMVEYGYVAIAGHQYLLPTHASVSLQRGGRKIELNDISFRNYSRFASQTKITVPR